MNDLNLVFVLDPQIHRAALVRMQQVFAYYIYIYISYIWVGYISHIKLLT